jgi:cell division protein FtsW
MTARPVDLNPAGYIRLPDSGLGRGWEAAAVMGLTLLILSLGLVTLYSASSVLGTTQDLGDTFYVVRQAKGALIGCGLFAACALLPYRAWKPLAWPLIGVTVLFLLLCVLPWTQGIAPARNGARRWLDLGITFQPSEIAKIAIIVWTAAIAVKKVEHFQSLRRGLLPFFAVWAVVIGLVALEPDFSTAMVITLLGALIVFSAGARVGHFAFLGALVSPIIYAQLMVGFRLERLRSFLNPLADEAGSGYQVTQSLIAFGSGGITGVGIGEGRQKYGFLPEAHNDFIFAMIGEEWGLMGVVVLVTLYTSMTLVGFRIASRAPDLFGELLAIGFTSLIALQAILHMAVGLALAPATGLSLPLVSYGRSNLVITMIALGILASVSRATPGAKAARA